MSTPLFLPFYTTMVTCISVPKGACHYGCKTETFVHLSRTTNALARISEIGALLRDSKNNLWLATRTGLFTFPLNVLNLPHDADCPVNRISVYKHIPLDEQHLPGNYITSVMEDREGRMWIGTMETVW